MRANISFRPVVAFVAVVGVALCSGGMVRPAEAGADLGVREGRISVGGSAAFSIAHPVSGGTSADTIWSLGANVGYFFMDEVSIDLESSFVGNFDDDVLIAFIPGLSYHFLPRQQWTPYLTAGVGFVHAKIEGDSDTEGAYQVGGGIKYFVASQISVDGGLRYLATFDDADKGAMSYGIGLSVYFD